MDNLFYSEFKKIIRECGYTNTYKMAWAKALVEISLEKKFNDREVVILLEDMAQKFLTHKSCNSSKTNGIPLQQDIENLKLRNKKLSLLLKQNNKKDKLVEELNLAIQKDYVNKFWISCKS